MIKVRRGDKVDFEIYREANWIQPITFSTGGTALNIVNWNPVMKVWDSVPLREGVPNEQVYELSTSNGRVRVPSPGDGLIQFELSPAETKDLPFEVASYRLHTDTDQNPNSFILEGRVIVK